MVSPPDNNYEQNPLPYQDQELLAKKSIDR